jgi:predicted negative regulator of RcsB-dependent stress response
MAEEYLTDAEQAEEVKRLFKEYAPVVILGVVLGGGGYFGWGYYKNFETGRSIKAGEEFSQMGMALQINDTKKAKSIGEGIIKDYSGLPYADQARLTLARIAVDEGHDADAVTPLTEVMNNSKDSELKQIARLRLARVLIDQGKPDDALALLDVAHAGTFAGRYHQVRGDALLAKKDSAGAISEYKTALTSAADGGVDGSLVEMKLADLGANGDAPTTTKVKP